MRTEGLVAVTNVSVVPMDREVVLNDQTVVIRDGWIESVGAAAGIDARQMRVIDGRGKWLMPALADMHVHFWDPSEANLFLANGIAHVRNMWGTPLHLAWRQKVAKREVAGPRVTTTGPIVDGAGPDGKTIWPGSVLLAAPEDAGPLVKRLADRGYAQVKALSALQLEPLRALCAAAKTRGIPVTGHCPRVVLYEEAIDAGMRCFEHFAAIDNGHVPDGESSPALGPTNWLDRLRRLARLDLEQIRVLAARMAREQIWNCPTLVVQRQITQARADALATPHLEYVRSFTRESWDPKEDFRFRGMPFTWDDIEPAARKVDEVLRQVVRILRDEGAPLLLGTDTPNPYVIPGFSIHQELSHLRAAGLSAYEVLRTGTTEAARFLAEDDEWGTIAPARRADMVLLSRDPPGDVEALRQIDHVFVNGHDLDRSALDELLVARLRDVGRGLDPLTLGRGDVKWNILHAGRPFGRLATRHESTGERTHLQEESATFQWGETRRRAKAVLTSDGSVETLSATTQTGFGRETLSIERTPAGYRAHLVAVDGCGLDSSVEGSTAPPSLRVMPSAFASFRSSPHSTALSFEDEHLVLVSVSEGSDPGAASPSPRTLTFSRPGEAFQFVLTFDDAGQLSRVAQRMPLGVREWIVEGSA